MAIILGVKQSAKTYQFLQDTNNFSYLNSINSSNLLFLNVDENTNNNAVIRFKNNYEFGYINNKIAIKNVSNLIDIDNNAINLYKNTSMYCNLNVDNYFYTENNSTIFNNNIKLNFNNNIDNSFKIIKNNSELPIFEVFNNKINIRSPNVYASNIWLSSNSTLYTNFIDSPNDKPVVITNMSFAESLRIFSANIVQNISLDNDIVFTDLINKNPYAKNPFDILSEDEWNTYMVDNSINIRDPNFMKPNIYVCKYILPDTNIGGSNIVEFRTKIIGDNSSNSNLIFTINNKGYISIDNKYNSNIPLNINVLPTGSNIIQYTNINDSNNKCYCVNSNGFINIGKLDFSPNQLNIFKNNNYDRNNTELISLNINNSNNTSNNGNTKIIFNNNSNFTDFKFIFQSLNKTGNNYEFDIIITNNYIIDNIIPINSLIYETDGYYANYVTIMPDDGNIRPKIKYPNNGLKPQIFQRINNTIKYKIYPPPPASEPDIANLSLFNKLIYNITITGVVITIEFYIYHSIYEYNYTGKYYPKLCNLISGKTNSNAIFEVSQQGNIGIGANYTDNYKLYINENALINNIDCKYIDNYLTKNISMCNCILNDIDIVNANLIKSKKLTSLNVETNDCLIYSNCSINSNLTILPNDGQFIVSTKSIFGLNTTQHLNYLMTLNTINNGNGLVINNNAINNNPNILINSSCELSYPYVRLKTLTNSYNLILSNNNFEINDTINKNKLFQNNSNDNSISLLNNCFNIFKDTSGNIKFYAGCLTASADWYGDISTFGKNIEKKSSFNIYGDFKVYNIANRPIISCFNGINNRVKVGFGTDAETYISDENNDLIIDYNTLFSSNITVMDNIYLSGTLLSISDCNLKTNIKKIENPLKKIQSISGYTYTRTDTGNMETGLIAQEVLNILPEVISYNLNNNYTISYGNMCGILVECIKELNEKINVLETKLKTK
jgi:hypothetical protein